MNGTLCVDLMAPCSDLSRSSLPGLKATNMRPACCKLEKEEKGLELDLNSLSLSVSQRDEDEW